MRTIPITLGLVVSFLVAGCRSPRTIDLDTGLHGIQYGEYTLVVITDQFVSFQSSTYKDQYYFAAPLPPEVLARIKAAMAAGNTSSQPIHLEDLRSGV